MRRIAAHLITAFVALAARAEGVDPAERLQIVDLLPGLEMTSRLEREGVRVYALCHARESDPVGWEHLVACMERHVDAKPWRIATVHRAPDPASAVAGFVDAVFRAKAGGLELALEFAPASDPSRRTVWLAGSHPAWERGLLDLPGVRTRGNWIELTGAPFSEPSWLDGSAAGLSVYVSPIERSVVELRAIPAVFPDGERRAIEPGSYFVERIEDGVIFFRDEVEADYYVGHPLPAALPPTLRANVADLFGAGGEPLFVDGPSGC
jgi:hypothetical protein